MKLPNRSVLVAPAIALLFVLCPFAPRQCGQLLWAAEDLGRVVAWVNGKPLYEDEIVLTVDESREAASLPAPQRAEKIREFMIKERNIAIDYELLYQDAIKKLEQGNPRALEKLRELPIKNLQGE